MNGSIKLIQYNPSLQEAKDTLFISKRVFNNNNNSFFVGPRCLAEVPEIFWWSKNPVLCSMDEIMREFCKGEFTNFKLLWWQL